MNLITISAAINKKLIKKFLFKFAAVFLLILSSGCQFSPCTIEPHLGYTIPQKVIEKKPSPFAELTRDEMNQPWGRELFLGKKFAREMDLYRSLTCFKSALFLIPAELVERRLEIEYEICLAYFLGNKYQETIEFFESGELISIPETFPAFHDLLVILYDSYIKIGRPEKACQLLNYISNIDPEMANELNLGTAVMQAETDTALQLSKNSPLETDVKAFLTDYHLNAKSVSKARTLNALLPGAGYYYVGQKKAALTSFIINALFIAASYQLFEKGYYPAAIITTSLETGWYFGGINGAGLAAKEYNERLYESLGRECLIKNRLFPVLMLNMSF